MATQKTSQTKRPLLFYAVLAGAIAMLIRVLPYLLPGKTGKVKNEDVWAFLTDQKYRGPLRNHRQWGQFPLPGVYMFQHMGPWALIDFTHAVDWDPAKGTFAHDYFSTMLQEGLTFAHGIPYIPGLLPTKLFANVGTFIEEYRCPPKMRDGQYCVLWTPSEKKVKFVMLREDGGRKFVRDSYFFEDANNTDFGTINFHSYNLLKVADGRGKVDEEHYNTLMEKLNGQDLVYSPRLGFD